MATRKKELEMLACGQDVLAKAADDEPVFILRAQDSFAPDVILFWAERVAWMSGRFGSDNKQSDATATKIAEARALAYEMRAWQERTGRAKVPD